MSLPQAVKSQSEGGDVAKTFSLTSALDGVGGQQYPPHPLCSRERDMVPIVQDAGWAPEPVCTNEENNNSLGNDYTRIRGATQKFGEFKQRAHTGCRMPFRR